MTLSWRNTPLAQSIWFAVNLYPFAATVANPKPLADAIENIDIGGSTMVRSAAKNHKDVTIGKCERLHPRRSGKWMPTPTG